MAAIGDVPEAPSDRTMPRAPNRHKPTPAARGGDVGKCRGDDTLRRMDAKTAARIDRAEARLSLAVAAAAAPPSFNLVTALGGGFAVLVRPGSPINKVIGAGFDGPLAADALAEVEATWHAHGEPVRIELASLAAPAAAEQLGARGYRLLGCEHVLVRPLTPADGEAEPAHVVLPDRPAWMSTLVDGFAAPDGTGAPVDHHDRAAIAAVMQDFAGAQGFLRYVADLDGAPVGAASMRIDDGLALLCGATTLPAARRRGVQAALSTARLRDASRAGCSLAVVTTAPGSLSQSNAERQGFALAYARVIVALPPAGPR
jgi:GNAT superfamily N-acetyltransferase